MAFSESDYIELFVKGGIVGQLIGDALGYPFNNSTNIPPIDQIDMKDPAGQEIGSFTHVSSLSLCTLASINEFNHVDPGDIMDRFHDFYVGGYLTPNQECFEIDGTTAQAIKNHSSGMPVDRCGLKNQDSKDNNALSRSLIIGMYHATDNVSTLIDEAHKVCQLTHNSPSAKVCSALYALIIRNLLLQKAEKVFDVLGEYYQELDDQELIDMLQFVKDWKNDNDISGSSYVIDSFWTSWNAFSRHQSDFKYCVSTAVKHGGIANVTGAISGSLAGLKTGVNDIPYKWITMLKLTSNSEVVTEVSRFISTVVKKVLDNQSVKS